MLWEAQVTPNHTTGNSNHGPCVVLDGQCCAVLHTWHGIFSLHLHNDLSDKVLSLYPMHIWRYGPNLSNLPGRAGFGSSLSASLACALGHHLCSCVVECCGDAWGGRRWHATSVPAPHCLPPRARNVYYWELRSEKSPNMLKQDRIYKEACFYRPPIRTVILLCLLAKPENSVACKAHTFLLWFFFLINSQHYTRISN